MLLGGRTGALDDLSYAVTPMSSQFQAPPGPPSAPTSSPASEDESPSELSVELRWPVDPLVGSSEQDDGADDDDELVDEDQVRLLAPLVERIDTLRDALGGQALPPRRVARSGDLGDVVDQLDDLVAVLQYLTAELLDVLAGALDRVLAAGLPTAEDVGQTVAVVVDDRLVTLRSGLMSMITAQNEDAQRERKRDRDAIVTSLRDEIDDVVTAATDPLVDELKALRRRMPVSGKPKALADAGSDSDLDEAFLDELVERVADEVELRVVAATDPQRRKKRK